jgi:hypothetical protein
LFAITGCLPRITSFSQQSLQQLGASPRFDNPLALLLHLHFRLPLAVFDIPNFAPRVQTVGVQRLQFRPVHRDLPKHFPFAADALAFDVLFLFAQRLQIHSQLFQPGLFERGLPGPPEAHAV